MRSRVVTLLLASAGLALALRPAAAAACSGSICAPERYLPFDGSLPANAPGIWWLPGLGATSDVETAVDELSLRCGASDDAMRKIALDSDPLERGALLVPRSALVAGETCELSGGSACLFEPSEGHLTGRSRFAVTESAPWPTSLGELHASDAAIGELQTAQNASCWGSADACSIELTLELSDEAAPYASALVFTTIVDGEPWSFSRARNVPNVTGGSGVGRGRDLIYAWLRGSGAQEREPGSPPLEPGLTPGEHVVTMRATLPGTDVMLETEPVVVALDCEPSPSSCSATPHRGSASTLASMLAPLLAALAWRRRRRLL